jgi:hypothetical protein
MKVLTLLLGLVVLAAGCVIYVPRDAAGDLPGSGERGRYDYQGSRYAPEYGPEYFYETLSPFGFWVGYAPYGHVWVPHGTPYGWRPYTSGRWLWSDHGWTWVSDHDWGWACFHYGRWGWDPALGWYWVPGFVWGPSWVAWRHGPGHIGWAPLPPDVLFEAGSGLSSLPYELSDRHWVFVEDRHFYDTRLLPHVIPPERSLTFVRASQLRTDIAVQGERILNRGLDVNLVSDMTGKGITEHRIRPARFAGRAEVHTGFLYLYSPLMRADESSAPPGELDAAEVRDRVIERKMESYRSTGERAVEEEIDRLQSLERKRLEESQQQEIERLRRQNELKTGKAKTRSERERIEQENKDRLVRAKTRHDQERTRIKNRHAEEREKAAKATAAKKKKK